MTKFKKTFLRYRLPLFLFCVFIGLWELLIKIGNYPVYLLPGPWDVLSLIPSRLGDLWFSFSLTWEEAAGGFLASGLIGIGIALVFAISPVIRKGLLPYVVLFQTIPIIAVSPLIILWCGSGQFAVCVIAFMICLPPVIANVTQGLISVEQNQVDLFRMSNASTLTLLFKLRLPHALPNIFTGLRIASGGAVVGAFVGETFAGSSSVGQGGLGYAALYAQNQTETAYLFALILTSSLMGLFFFFIVSATEWFCLRNWHESVIAGQPN
jgi:NitT/TauT family transport system permease protein